MATKAQIAERKNLLAYLKEHPDSHHQASWIGVKEDPFLDSVVDGVVSLSRMIEGSCNTTACIAGRVALRNAPPGTLFNALSDILIFPNGELQNIADYAANVLGISASVASQLFFSAKDTAIKRLEYLCEFPDAHSVKISQIF
jgi:hypothetical protein